MDHHLAQADSCAASFFHESNLFTLTYENPSDKILGFKQNENFVEEEVFHQNCFHIFKSRPFFLSCPVLRDGGWHLDKTAALNPYSHLDWI